MNGMARNTLFGNPATQLAGVMFTSTHKEPGKRQFVWICINLNKGRRKSARILLGLEVNIWLRLIYSFIDPVLVQPKQSKARWWNIFKIYMDLLPFSAMLVISFLSSLLSTTSLWGTLGEAGWLMIIDHTWIWRGAARLVRLWCDFVYNQASIKRGTWDPGSMDPGTFPENNEKTYNLKQGCRI